MRILVVTNLYPTPERPYISPFVREQIESLQACYPDIRIDVRVIKGERPRWGYIRETPLLPFIVKNGEYDIVHAHFGLTLVSTLFVRTPIVITFHGSDLLVNPTKHISRLLAPMASKVIVVAQRLKEALGYGEVIPCGIDVDKFVMPDSFENRPIPKMPGKIKVLFPSDPARIVKNYAMFSDVCKELEMRGNKIEKIHLMNVEREKVHEIYWDCDIMLLTSFSEGSPTVIKEAIAAKLPFVSVDVGDVKEWTSLIEFGIVVKGREPKNFADAAANLFSSIKHRALLDNSKCIEAMDLKSISKRIRSVYDEVIEQSRL